VAHGLDGGLVGYLVSTFFFSELFYPVIWVQLSMTVALHQISKMGAHCMDRDVLATNAQRVNYT
jgi:hypothetical protein